MSPKAPDDLFLKPAEAAELVGVSTATVAVWARNGVLQPAAITPGGHRRYRRADVLAVRDAAQQTHPQRTQLEEDLVRLYEQGWPIRRVAAEFGFSYSKTRRILIKHTVLRSH